MKKSKNRLKLSAYRPNDQKRIAYGRLFYDNEVLIQRYRWNPTATGKQILIELFGEEFVNKIPLLNAARSRSSNGVKPIPNAETITKGEKREHV